MHRLLAALGRDTAADPDLLARFARERDEAAFAELVRRHGPLVWGVCCRGLANPADAEDAFQATFLVLVRRADRAAAHPAVGAWLHRVARMTVRNLARGNRRRAAAVSRLEGDAFTSDSGPSQADARLDLDAALAALPDRLRVPVVLCHLQGLSRKEAAARLGCPEGTLSATLHAALTRLRRRLGAADPAAVLAVAGAVATPPAVAAATVRAAAIYSISRSAAGVSPVAAGLANGVLHMFWVKKLAATGAVLLAAGGLTVGAVWQAGGGDGVKAPPTGVAKPAGPQPPDDLKRRWETLQQDLELLRQRDAALRAESDAIAARLMANRKEAETVAERMKAVQNAARDRATAGSGLRWRVDVLAESPTGHFVQLQLLAADGTVVGEAQLSDGLIPVLLPRLPPPADGAVIVRTVKDAPLARAKAVLDALATAGFTRVSQTEAGSTPWNTRPQRLPTDAELERLFGPMPAPRKR